MKNSLVKPTKYADKRSVSAPSPLFDAAEGIMKKRLMSNFSEYVRDLIRRDLAAAEKLNGQKEAA